MASGKKCESVLKSKCGDVEELGLGMLVRYPRVIGGKRILISKDLEISPIDSAPEKKRCVEGMVLDSESSRLEALPQDILIRVLCGVNHEDLKQLFHVSKAVREATIIAKKLHFAYSTPSKTRAFRTAIDFDDSSELDEIEAPNAPKQLRRCRSRLRAKKFASISVSLFSSPKEENWPRKTLFMEM